MLERRGEFTLKDDVKRRDEQHHNSERQRQPDGPAAARAGRAEGDAAVPI